MGVLLFIVIVGATVVTAVDAAQYTKDEYGAAFRRPDFKYYFVASPLLLFLCGAGIAAPPVYYLWARRRLVLTRQGRVLKAPLVVRASDRMLVGNWERGLRIVDTQMEQAATRGESEFTLRVREGDVGAGLLDGWPEFVNLALSRVSDRGGSVVNVNEIGQPGARMIVLRVTVP